MFKLALCQIKGSFDKKESMATVTRYVETASRKWRTGDFSAGDVELSVFQRLFQRVRRSGRRPYGEVPVGSGCKA